MRNSRSWTLRTPHPSCPQTVLAQRPWVLLVHLLRSSFDIECALWTFWDCAVALAVLDRTRHVNASPCWDSRVLWRSTHRLLAMHSFTGTGGSSVRVTLSRAMARLGRLAPRPKASTVMREQPRPGYIKETQHWECILFLQVQMQYISNGNVHSWVMTPSVSHL